MNNEDMSDVLKNLNNIAAKNNISQDTINNLFNMFNNSSNTTQPSNNEQNNQNSSSNNATYNNSSFDNSNIDFETILKMKNIIDKMNVKDDPRSNLLKSLKPYLNDSRKSKIDQYIQLMNMSKVMDVFPFIGGDKKK